MLYVACRSVRHWTETKARPAFCAVAQDGDDEGVLRLHRLPTPAAVIPEFLGIRKRQEISARISAGQPLDAVGHGDFLKNVWVPLCCPHRMRRCIPNNLTHLSLSLTAEPSTNRERTERGWCKNDPVTVLPMHWTLHPRVDRLLI
jgi:hypothetical protein